jgi:predicted nucleic acid-binding protein
MAGTIVVDASVGIGLVSPDESAHASMTDRYEQLSLGGARMITTSFYAFETGNALARSKVKTLVLGRYDEARALAVPTLLREEGLHRALRIAMEGKLSFYDAAYVALAEQENGLLWTEDKELLRRFPSVAANTSDVMRRSTEAHR